MKAGCIGRYRVVFDYVENPNLAAIRWSAGLGHEPGSPEVHPVALGNKNNAPAECFSVPGMIFSTHLVPGTDK